MLSDIAVPHVYVGKKSTKPLNFILHPFTQTVGEWKDHYEIIFTRIYGGKPSKKSGHVTKFELAEMFARDILDSHGIRVRLRPAANDYPDAAPGKLVPRDCTRQGSDFESLVARVDIERAMSDGLGKQLIMMNVIN